MKLSELKRHLERVQHLSFVQPNGMIIPSHFHITEAGLVSKQFIDCGGVLRNEKNISFQLWVAGDTEHRLSPEKFKKIIDLAAGVLNGEDREVEVEYQGETIGRYRLEFDGIHFLLEPTFTNCLASDKCGIPPEKQKVNLAQLQASACKPGGGCC